MRRQRTLHGVLFFSWVLGACGGQAAAQAGSNAPVVSPVEVWGAFSVLNWTGTGRLDSSYEPQLVASPDAEGHARQTLTLDPALARGFEAGVNVFPARHLGIQVFFSNARADLGGTNAPYELDLRYVSRQPPGNEPVSRELSWSLEWPDTAGRLEQWSFGAGPVAAWRTPRAGVSVSGGVAWIRSSGEVEPLGFTVFHLGGHSTLFYDDFRVQASLGPTTVTAAYVSAAFDVALGRHVAATAGFRAFIGGEAETPARIEAVVESTAGFSPPPVTDIDRQMAPGPARLSPAALGFSVGIKIR